MTEKDASIDYILSRGLIKPKALRESISEMLRALGPRYIFFDMSQALVLTVIVMAGLALPAVSLLRSYLGHTYAPAFAVSPMLFVCLTLITEFIERASGLYELKMTAKYTLRQVTALRVLCFTLPGALFSVIISAVFCRVSEVHSFFRVLSLSLCSLFLYAFATTLILRKLPRKWLAPAVIWIALCALPQVILGDAWEHLLTGLPAAVTLGIAVLGCAMYLREIKKLMNRSYDYAYSQ